jgi:nucleotide-binding universal stress UspA family protein
MKTILCLTDFSKGSHNAINYAIQCFEDHSCIFHVLHVHKADSFTTDNFMLASRGSIYDTIVKVPKKKLEDYIDKLQKKFKNDKHAFQAHIDFDGFNAAVLQAANAYKVDVIVLGSNGATGAKEVVFGSNALNVIRHINYPTLIIPEDYLYKECKEILLPLDPEDSLSGEPFTKIIEFTESHKTHFHVLRINQNSENSDAIRYDKSHLALFDCEYSSINGVPLQHAVNSSLQTRDIDLIALIVQKEGFLERLFFGSSTKQISQLTKLPLFIVHS